VVKSGLVAPLVDMESFTEEEKASHLKLQKELKDAQEDENSFFMCLICFKVLLDPMECTKCDTPFCSDCIT